MLTRLLLLVLLEKVVVMASVGYTIAISRYGRGNDGVQ